MLSLPGLSQRRLPSKRQVAIRIHEVESFKIAKWCMFFWFPLHQLSQSAITFAAKDVSSASQIDSLNASGKNNLLLYINFLLHWGSDKVLARSPVWQTAWKNGRCVRGEQAIAPGWCLPVSFQQLRRNPAANHCYPAITENHSGATGPRTAAQPGPFDSRFTLHSCLLPPQYGPQTKPADATGIANPARRNLVPSFRVLASLETLVL